MRIQLSILVLTIVLSTNLYARELLTITNVGYGGYKEMTIEKTSPFAARCIKYADPNFKGDYTYSTGQYKPTSPVFGVLVGMKTTNVVGDDWIKYSRCMFKLSDGKHDEDWIDLSPGSARVESYGNLVGMGSIK